MPPLYQVCCHDPYPTLLTDRELVVYDRDMTATKATGFRVTCKPCDKVTFWTPDQMRERNNKLIGHYGYLECAGCGRERIPETVTGRKGTKPCGSWCTEGTGKTCTCICEGRNHGSAYPAGTLFYLS